LFHGHLFVEGHFSQELQVIFWTTFFTKIKGTLFATGERALFVSSKNLGGRPPLPPPPSCFWVVHSIEQGERGSWSLFCQCTLTFDSNIDRNGLKIAGACCWQSINDKIRRPVRLSL
jgi:hypothetical protein